jgi:hypothetical protein
MSASTTIHGAIATWLAVSLLCFACNSGANGKMSFAGEPMVFAEAPSTQSSSTEAQRVTAAVVDPEATVPAADGSSAAADEASRRAAAVALNYSRAAFHRIRQQPSYRVLYEEQQKILDHLNLNGIADEDVVKLYAAVLDEIAQIQLSDRERELLQDRYRRQVTQQVGLNSMTLAAQVLTAQYAQAVRTGCSSWWDFRSAGANRELDLHRVDKERLQALLEKSARFLDVSWKMARARQIPDRWLVRGDDLDQLETACKETDHQVRLRVLKRMEPFLECYPPYWYYLARTQQATGQLTAAVQTYNRLEKMGDGHFRKDEMLASGLANRALIQAYLEQPGAVASAQKALSHSMEVWEANLICAKVLTQHQRFQDAEDAILRNLDVSLERSQSQLALVQLYYDADDRPRLAGWLSDPLVTKDLPAALLARYAARLGADQTPSAVASALQRSLQATPRVQLGRTDLAIQAAHAWRLSEAELSLKVGDRVLKTARIQPRSEGTIAVFEGVTDRNFTRGTTAELTEVTLTITYPDAAPISLTLQTDSGVAAETNSALSLTTRRSPVLHIADWKQDGYELSWRSGVFQAQADRPRSSNSGSRFNTDDRASLRAVPAGRVQPSAHNDEPILELPPIDITTGPTIR